MSERNLSANLVGFLTRSFRFISKIPNISKEKDCHRLISDYFLEYGRKSKDPLLAAAIVL